MIKSFISAFSAGALLICTAINANHALASTKSDAKKPNLVVILTDDQGYADVGFNGSKDIITPNIDKIASQGVKFTSGYVTAPVCAPSRAGLLTGRYQNRFGIIRNIATDPTNKTAGIPTTEKNIAEVLKPAGYRSGIIGKWHAGTHEIFHPNNRGFDFFYGFLSGGHQYYPEQLTLNDLSEVTKKWEWYHTRLLKNKTPVDIDEYLTDELSNEAVDFIKREKDNPFFLYVAYNAPHLPLQATKKYLDRFPNIKNKKRKTYAAMISAVDDGVGRILKELKTQAVDDNTLVIFLSDNGGAKDNGSDNRELRGAKGSLFEGGIRVPFAARWPNVIPAGTEYEHPVSSLDILATIVAESGVNTEGNKPLDGTNLIPYITGTKQGQPHEILFWRRISHSFAARSGDKKVMILKGGKWCTT